MTIVISEGITLTASAKTCANVREALRLIEDAKRVNYIDWDWQDAESEIAYCYGRAEVLLGLAPLDDYARDCLGPWN